MRPGRRGPGSSAQRADPCALASMRPGITRKVDPRIKLPIFQGVNEAGSERWPRKAPGKAHREGRHRSMRPGRRGPLGRQVSERTREAACQDALRCTDCRLTLASMTAGAKRPRKWAIAIYLCLTSLKSRIQYEVASRHRRIAAYRGRRGRRKWVLGSDGPFDGPVEVDAYIGGRKELQEHVEGEEAPEARARPGRRRMVMGAKDRATNRVLQ